MPLYERIAGLEKPKISPHTFMSVLQEFSLGNMSAAQATTALGLDAGEQTQAVALRDRILAEVDANPVVQGILRRLKALEIENVLILAETRTAPYDVILNVTTRLGV